MRLARTSDFHRDGLAIRFLTIRNNTPSIGTADRNGTCNEKWLLVSLEGWCLICSAHCCIFSIHYIMSWIYVNFWWPRMGSNHWHSRLQRDALPLSYLAKIMHIDRTWTCTSDGYLPAGLSMDFNHKGHCLFYQTQLPLCVYLFRHECIKIFNIHHPSSNCHSHHQHSIDSCMNVASV